MRIISVFGSSDTRLTKVLEFEPKLIDKMVAYFLSTQSGM
jgi:hypothetical protein